MAGFIITEPGHDGTVRHVVAPPGWSWTPRGLEREPIGYRSPSPEWGGPSQNPHVFRSHRAAARVANLCPSSRIVELR